MGPRTIQISLGDIPPAATFSFPHNITWLMSVLDSCHSLLKPTTQGGRLGRPGYFSHTGEGTEALGHLARLSEDGPVWGNSLHPGSQPLCAAHLGQPLKQSNYAIALLKIFPSLPLFLRIMSKLLTRLTSAFQIWDVALLTSLDLC